MDGFTLSQSYFSEGAGKPAGVGSREEDEGAMGV